MARVGERVELVLLAVGGELGVDARDLLRVGVGVLRAEESEERATDVGGHVDRRRPDARA